MTMSSVGGTEAQRRDRWSNTRLILEGLALGVLYGLFFRLSARFKWLSWNPSLIMTMAFLFLGPLVMGIITVRRSAGARQMALWKWIVIPWITVGITMVASVLLYMEGSICVVFALPFALTGASLGGIIGGLSARSGKMSARTITCIAFLPLLLAPAETQLSAPTQIRTVSSEICIHASPSTIWQNIERVPPISPAELRTTWTHRIGFPRPVEATLSYEGVGGVRHASFERGLMFVETVTTWEPNQRLAFGIKADTAHIPSTTLDEHVTIGGRYFDVLDGEYRLEPLSNGETLLHLTSHQRLSTDFNGYAGLWSDAVMQTLQTSILEVIQHRCEHD